jgi:hypothetical protein
VPILRSAVRKLNIFFIEVAPFCSRMNDEYFLKCANVGYLNEYAVLKKSPQRETTMMKNEAHVLYGWSSLHLILGLK